MGSVCSISSSSRLSISPNACSSSKFAKSAIGPRGVWSHRNRCRSRPCRRQGRRSRVATRQSIAGVIRESAAAFEDPRMTDAISSSRLGEVSGCERPSGRRSWDDWGTTWQSGRRLGPLSRGVGSGSCCWSRGRSKRSLTPVRLPLIVWVLCPSGKPGRSAPMCGPTWIEVARGFPSHQSPAWASPEERLCRHAVRLPFRPRKSSNAFGQLAQENKFAAREFSRGSPHLSESMTRPATRRPAVLGPADTG